MYSFRLALPWLITHTLESSWTLKCIFLLQIFMINPRISRTVYNVLGWIYCGQHVCPSAVRFGRAGLQQPSLCQVLYGEITSDPFIFLWAPFGDEKKAARRESTRKIKISTLGHFASIDRTFILSRVYRLFLEDFGDTIRVQKWCPFSVGELQPKPFNKQHFLIELP